MKNHVVRVAILFCTLPTTVFSQSDKKLDPGYYIVVSAYGQSREDYAKSYLDQLNEEGIKADYGFDNGRNYFYVYLEYFDLFKPAIDRMRSVRSEGRFKDAWVRVMPGTVVEAKEPAVIDEKEAPAEGPLSSETEDMVDQVKDEESEDETAVLIYPPPGEVKKEEITEPQIIEETKVVSLANTPVYLNLFNPTSNRMVDGKVQVIDTERSKLLGAFPANEPVSLPDPKTSTGELTLISEAFGFRKMQHQINYFAPLADTMDFYVEYVDDTLAVNFDLIKYRRGDITILYNVYFYDDAALMRPESKYELNALVNMMQENPDYKIRLHGHTNDKYIGKIIDAGPSKEFFEITPDAVISNGSAKNLSRKRAENIRDYLVLNGIDAKRVDVKAWGGKKPLYNKLGPEARQNVRVEVEILDD